MDEIRFLTDGAIAFRILFSLLLGGILGLERGLKNRPAGLRTYILVCMGSCIVMMTNQYVYQVYDTGDPVRMAAQVISGIGFLGAGTIIVTRRNQIKGLTACVGLSIGIGLYEVAVIGGAAIFVVLTFLNHWDFFIRNRARDAEAYVEIPLDMSFSVFLHEAKMRGIMVRNVQSEVEEGSAEGKFCFICTLRGTKRMEHIEMLSLIKTISEGIYVEEI